MPGSCHLQITRGFAEREENNALPAEAAACRVDLSSKPFRSRRCLVSWCRMPPAHCLFKPPVQLRTMCLEREIYGKGSICQGSPGFAACVQKSYIARCQEKKVHPVAVWEGAHFSI